MKRALVALAVVLLAAPARAGDVAQVATALRSAPVYQARGLDLVDVATLTSELAGSSPQLYVAALPSSAAATAAEAKDLAIAIGTRLAKTDDVVLVITAGGKLGAGQGSVARAHGVDAAAALTEELKDLHDLSKGSLTAFVLSFAERVTNQVATPAPALYEREVPAPPAGSGAGWLVAGSVVGLLGLAGVAVVVRRRTRPGD